MEKGFDALHLKEKLKKVKIPDCKVVSSTPRPTRLPTLNCSVVYKRDKYKLLLMRDSAKCHKCKCTSYVIIAKMLVQKMK